MTPSIQGNHLTPELRALVAHITSRLGAAAQAIDAQAAQARVAVATPTVVDLEVPDDVPPIPLADGPIPVRAIVYDSRQELTGEILLWVRAGMLVGLEQAWFTDEPPSEWPPPAMVRLT